MARAIYENGTKELCYDRSMPAAMLTLQIVTLVVALVGPVIAYYFARRLAISANRLVWLDGLRQDLAQLIAVADALAILMMQMRSCTKPLEKRDAEQRILDELTLLQTIRCRVVLRLNEGNPDHAALATALETLIDAHGNPPEERAAMRAEVVAIARSILYGVWKRIERGK